MSRFYILLMGLTMLIGCQNTNVLQPGNFERVLNGQQTKLYTIENSNGCIAQFSNYGGRWLSMWVPDKDGDLKDVILGFDDLEGYINAAEPYHGAITGRVCGRINQGLFNMNGQEYRLANNDLFGKPLKNHLHGGVEGFHEKVWEAITGENEKGEQFVEFSYLSKDGEEGYPGNLDVDVRYTLTSENALRIEFSAETDKNTIVNLTNHAYFNLTGDPSNNISEQLMQINADKYVACDKELVPTGEVNSLKNSLIDFTSPMSIGKNINGEHSEIIKGKGYAIAYALNKNNQPFFYAAKLTDPIDGINVSVYTDQPSLQFYNAWLMDGTDVGKGGIPYHLGAGVVLETQGFPDAPNHPNFPSIEVTPATPYYHIVEYRFGVEDFSSFENPIQRTGADPWVVKHGDKYYLSESDGGQHIFIKESETITGIGASVSQEIFDVSNKTKEQFAAWGPHLNYIEGEWYIYYCAQSVNDPEFKSQRMWVLKSSTDSPYGPYESMGEVLNSGDKEWAIDGSVLGRENGDLYFVWSGIDDLSTLHQKTYIAKMISPTRVDRSTITLISEPTEPWETSVRPIQEGQRPLMIDKEGKTIIMYSANASWTDEYCLGSLTNTDGDFLNPKSWVKSQGPVFKKTSAIFGPGGASYVKSPDGSEDWIVYHSAKKAGAGWDRQINTQPFSWSASGDPIFGEPIGVGVKITKPVGE